VTAGAQTGGVVSGNPGGRPSKLTLELRGRIVTLVAAGNPLSVAAEACGVRRQTLHEWVKRGEGTGRADAPYRAFAAAVAQARAASEADLVALMRKASVSGSWKATAWLLERAAPERWGAKPAPIEKPAELDAFAEVDQLAARRAARVK
jgi:hypothetical protein